MWKHNVHHCCPERIHSDDDDESEEYEPQYLNTSTLEFLEASKDRLTVRYSNARATTHQDDAGTIQANREVPQHCAVYYFEVLVNNGGLRTQITIGFSDKTYRLARQIGEDSGSMGYRGADGKKYNGNGPTPGRGEEYGPPFGTDDVVGAGIIMETQDMFFTLNGKKLDTAFSHVCKRALFPTVSLHSKDECVTVNFGQEPFAFDVEAFQTELLAEQNERLRSEVVSGSVAHDLVRTYLEHYGYGDTLRAYNGASGEPDVPQAGPSDRDKLGLRKQVRDELMRGDVPAATRTIHHHFPWLLTPGAIAQIDVPFYLSCLHFIELMRKASVVTSPQKGKAVLKEALEFSQQTLAPLRSRLAGDRMPASYTDMLHDVVALLAFPHPEESDLQMLLSFQQREAVADAVNAAMLANQAGVTGDPLPQAPLEQVLQQLTEVTRNLRKENQGYGEPFHLKNHLPRCFTPPPF